LQFRRRKTPTGGNFCSTRYGSEVGENGVQRRTEKKGGLVQGRVDLKGQVTEVYSCLLVSRWCFVELEQVWLHFGLLSASGDIFFEFDEVR